MKKDIHPKQVEANVVCSCGNTFTVMSNKKDLQIELCSLCHPFYTGKQNKTSQTGRVEKFNKKYGFNESEGE